VIIEHRLDICEKTVPPAGAGRGCMAPQRPGLARPPLALLCGWSTGTRSAFCHAWASGRHEVE